LNHYPVVTEGVVQYQMKALSINLQLGVYIDCDWNHCPVVAEGV
jgi:hypothetical protein